MQPHVRTYLVDDDGDRVFGPGPAELLRRVREHGSLRAAAMSMGMAYTKALALVKHAEKALGSPLTMRTIGGAGGGGSVPTPEADALLAAYERWSASVSRTSSAQYEAAVAGLRAKVPQAAHSSTRRVGAAILANGRSERYGAANKLMEPLFGEPVLAHTLGCVPAGLPMVVVSADVEVVAFCEGRGIDCAAPAGPDHADSVAAAAAYALAAGWEACVFIPGDQPLVEEGSLRALVAVGDARLDACVRLAWRGRRAAPALFPALMLGRMRGLAGDAGGAAALTPDDAVVAVEASWPWELWDIDTPDDLRRVSEILEAGLGRPA